VYGMKCAQIAVKTAAAALNCGNFSEEYLSNYEKQWTKAIGRQIKYGMAYRRWYRKTSNGKINAIFSMMKTFPFLNRLDMDFL
jgi:flavin-dependent dehydrogenase